VWKKNDRIVMRGSKVDVTASNRKLKKTECPGRKTGADERAGKATQSSSSYQKGRAALQNIKVKQAQLEYDKALGILVLRDSAERQAFEDGRRFRDAMMGLPDQYADRLAAVTNVREMREALRIMLRDAIGGVTDE
jgi:hypothetical protein